MENKISKIAAVADIHVSESDKGKLSSYFRAISEQAQVLLLCGDLTDNGLVTEAQVLFDELQYCSIPVVAVLGNHDHEKGEQGKIKEVLHSPNIHVLDGDSIVIADIGFAGVKGFCGGFDRFMLSTYGESEIKEFVKVAEEDALKLDAALAHMDTDHVNLKKIVLLHYAPIKETIIGEPEQIFPFLGCSRLEEPLNRRQVRAAFHGHAHLGTMEGKTGTGIPVFNVSKPLLNKAGIKPEVYIYHVN